MNENKEAKKWVPPYLSYKTFINFLERLKVGGVPNRIDRSLMGSFSGAAQIQILTTLKYLHLINPDDTSTEKLSKLVTTEGIDKKVLRDIIVASYPFLFKDGVDLKKTTLHHLQELFEAAGVSGGTTRKSIAFFIAAAKDTGIELYHNLKMKGLSHSFGKKSKRGTIDRTEKNGVIETSEQPTEGRSMALEEMQLWLSMFPKFDPSWSDEIKKSWFEGFRDLRKDFKQKSDEEKEETK